MLFLFDKIDLNYYTQISSLYNLMYNLNIIVNKKVMKKAITTTETSYQLLFKDGRTSSTVYHRFLDALKDAKEWKDVAGLVETICVFYENGISAKKGEVYLLHGEIVKTDDVKARIKELGVKAKFLGTIQCDEFAIVADCGLIVPYGKKGRLLQEFYIPDSRK